MKLPCIKKLFEKPGLPMFISNLNKDLEFEYAAFVQYVQHKACLHGATMLPLASMLDEHAGDEYAHMKLLSERINYLGGTPTIKIEKINTTEDSMKMLSFDFDGEQTAIDRYKSRISEAESIGELGTAQVLRDILNDEEDHKNDLMVVLDKRNNNGTN